MSATANSSEALTSRCAALFRGYRDGRRECLDVLVETASPLLWQVVRSQGADRQTAEDVVQVVWLTLLRKADSIRDPQALVGWLLTTARRESWRAMKRTAVPRQVDDPEDAMASLVALPGDRPDVTVEVHERQRLLWRHVQALPQRCRELMRVVASVDRPDYTELAEALGMPKGSIGPTRGRCLDKLRRSLMGDPAWEGAGDGR